MLTVESRVWRVTAAAAEVTVSADVGKINEMPIQDAPDAQIKEPAKVLQTPAELEVSTVIVEGDVVKQSEENYSEYVLNDGTTVRKKVTTTKHVRPVTTITHKTSGVEERHSVDKLTGTEVDEHVQILEPGVLQLKEDQLENETQVKESEEKVNDGTWIKRKVTTITVKCKKTPSAAQRESEKPSATLSSSVPGPQQFAVDQRPAQVLPSAVVSTEMPLKESLDLNARSTEAELDRKSENDQSVVAQSKPSIVPVKLTKLEPLSKDHASVTADTNKPSEVEQKSTTNEGDTAKQQQPRSGSPSLSVVRLTKLEPLSFERINGSSAVEQPRVGPSAETRTSSLPQRTPVQQAEQPQKPDVIQPTTEDMIVPIPNTRQLRGRPAWQPTTTAPLDDDLELRPAVDETPIEVEHTVDQFAKAPSNIKPAVEQEITETLTTAPGSFI